MRKLIVAAVALSMASFGLTGAGASPLEEVVLQPAAKDSTVFPDCTRATQLDCIESFGVLERAGDPSSLVLGKRVSDGKDNFKLCSPLDPTVCFEGQGPSQIYQVQTAAGIVNYFVAAERFTRKQSEQRDSGSGSAYLKTEVTSLNYPLPGFQSPTKTIQLKIRSSSIRPFSAQYVESTLDWDVENIRKGRLWTVSFVPLESRETIMKGGFWTLYEAHKSITKSTKCLRKGLFMTSYNFQDILDYNRFVSREVAFSQTWNPRDRSLTFPISTSGEGDFAPDNIQFAMDSVYLSCVTKKSFKANREFLVEVTSASGPQDSLVKSVTFKNRILTIKLTGVPRETVNVKITQPSS